MTENEIEGEIARVLDAEAEALRKLKDDLPMPVVLSVVRELADCRGKIVLSGCGTSAMAARKIAHTLNCIDRPAAFLPPSDAVHGGLGLLGAEDILILISKGGNTSELVSMIPACRARKARLIGVSENPESEIARRADIFLPVRVEREPCPFNMLATASALAVIAAFDAICIALMLYTGYTREQFRVIHPGGAVGERLTKGDLTYESGRL
ncbi:MAG: SIS domain-containing protein [Firmicutes bacterium]|nr:SIS domain-containing protein [Bacillota bacterium]